MTVISRKWPNGLNAVLTDGPTGHPLSMNFPDTVKIMGIIITNNNHSRQRCSVTYAEDEGLEKQHPVRNIHQMDP